MRGGLGVNGHGLARGDSGVAGVCLVAHERGGGGTRKLKEISQAVDALISQPVNNSVHNNSATAMHP
jgi:hypothetical protein